MSRTDRRAPRADRIQALLDAGDHGAARREALATRGDEAASDAERAAARDALASLAPDRGVVAAGALAVLVALAVAGRVLLRG